MAVQHTSRTGKTYFLHEKTTSAGKRNCFFSLEAEGQLAVAVPDGYEIYENVNGQVFLRKKVKQVIPPKELSVVEDALRKHGEPWQYRAEAKGNIITVYEADDLSVLDKLASEFGRGPLAPAEKLARANYMAVLRFILTDTKARAFATERFCFRGSIDDWILIGGPGTLSAHVRQFVRHLGRESFYDLS